MNRRLRWTVLAAIVLIGASALLLVQQSNTAAELPRLTWVATAHQLGVVGYRDPVGVVSPDGRHIAYSEGPYVRVVPIGGGSSPVLPAAEGQVRHLAWGAGHGGALIAEDTRAASRWWLIDLVRGTRRPLFGDRTEIQGATGTPSVAANALRFITPSPDGEWLAATAAGAEGPQVWRISADGSRGEVIRVAGRVSAPAWTPAGDIACVVTSDGRSRISVPCGERTFETTPELEAVGPIAFSNDAESLFFASPNERGMVDLWTAERRTGRARRLTAFDRDTYAPVAAADGTVLFKTQSYRTFVAEIELASGRQHQLATFQSETPSYDPTGRVVAVTYGTWRRAIDDANYPDIAQEIGTVASQPAAGPATAPLAVIADSISEDQAMTWSPNGRWIALHSHREMSDDIWLRPADGSAPDRRITFLGRGAEVGWPRWSPDGRTVLLDGASPGDGRSVMFVIGVDQNTGEVTTPLREITIDGIDGDLQHGEWLGGSGQIVAIGREAPGRHVVLTVPVTGGTPRIVHRFASDHDFPGLAASPDGRELAFVQRAPDGFYQIYRMPVAGGSLPVQVTFDPSHKSQPAWSPDGRRIAYTVWSYLAHFWTLDGM